MQNTGLLVQYYQTFIDQPNKKDFFLGMADYLDYADSVPEFETVLSSLNVEIKSKYQKLSDLQAALIIKCEAAYAIVKEYVDKAEITQSVIVSELSECRAWGSNGISGTLGPAKGMHDCLTTALYEIGKLPEHKDFAARFVQKFDTTIWDAGVVSHILRVPEYDELIDFEDDLNYEQKTTLWGQFQNVMQYWQVVKSGRSEYKQLIQHRKDDPSDTGTMWTIMNYSILIGEWKSIYEGTARDIHFFKPEELRPQLSRLHNHLLARSGGIVSKPVKSENKIKKITLIKSGIGRKIQIMVNDEELMAADTTKGVWGFLLKLAEKRSLENLPSYKTHIDYLNTNVQCRLYSKTGLALTKIVGESSDQLVCCVEIEIITQKTLERRKNQLRNT